MFISEWVIPLTAFPELHLQFFFIWQTFLYKWELYLTNEQKTQFIFLTNCWKTTFVRALICTWYHLLTCWEKTFPSLFWLNDTYAICSEFESRCSWKMSRSIMQCDQHLERNIVCLNYVWIGLSIRTDSSGNIYFFLVCFHLFMGLHEQI